MIFFQHTFSLSCSYSSSYSSSASTILLYSLLVKRLSSP
nr:MAG TPA: hypothetical protein [Bacteriophage sp.]